MNADRKAVSSQRLAVSIQHPVSSVHPSSFSLLPFISRREMLRVTTGLGLSFLLPGMDLFAAGSRGSQRQKSLITIWLAGGASQLETWDPHPGSKIGGPTNAIPTSIPDLRICDTYPQVAEQIKNLSVIRSLVSKEGDHERGTYYLKTGYRPNPVDKHPSLGAIVTHEKLADELEIPPHVSLCGGRWPSRGGFLGDQFDAFKIYDPGRNVRNMRSRVDQARQDRRLENLDIITQAFSRGRRNAVGNTLHELTVQRALEMMTSEQLKAFEIDKEPEQVTRRYGDTRFGRGCLVARRLVEQGVRAVEVTLTGWDTHANNFEGHTENSLILDPALASLIEDLKQRDLLDSTVVLCLSEFGRTPKVNPVDGRDHWPSGFSCLIGGGGIRSGVVLGATDPTGAKKEPEDPIEVHDLFATILQIMDVDYEKEFITSIGRPLSLSTGTPIQRLL